MEGEGSVTLGCGGCGGVSDFPESGTPHPDAWGGAAEVPVLPTEVLAHVLSLLEDGRTVAAAGCASKTLRALTERGNAARALWRAACFSSWAWLRETYDVNNSRYHGEWKSLFLDGNDDNRTAAFSWRLPNFTALPPDRVLSRPFRIEGTQHAFRLEAYPQGNQRQPASAGLMLSLYLAPADVGERAPGWCSCVGFTLSVENHRARWSSADVATAVVALGRALAAETCGWAPPASEDEEEQGDGRGETNAHAQAFDCYAENFQACGLDGQALYRLRSEGARPTLASVVAPLQGTLGLSQGMATLHLNLLVVWVEGGRFDPGGLSGRFWTFQGGRPIQWAPREAFCFREGRLSWGVHQLARLDTLKAPWEGFHMADAHAAEEKFPLTLKVLVCLRTMRLEVVTSDDLRAHAGLGLVDFSQPARHRNLEVPLSTTAEQLTALLEAELGIPVAEQRIWCFDSRDASALRPRSQLVRLASHVELGAEAGAHGDAGAHGAAAAAAAPGGANPPAEGRHGERRLYDTLCKTTGAFANMTQYAFRLFVDTPTAGGAAILEDGSTRTTDVPFRSEQSVMLFVKVWDADACCVAYADHVIVSLGAPLSAVFEQVRRLAGARLGLPHEARKRDLAGPSGSGGDGASPPTRASRRSSRHAPLAARADGGGEGATSDEERQRPRGSSGGAGDANDGDAAGESTGEALYAPGASLAGDAPVDPAADLLVAFVEDKPQQWMCDGEPIDWDAPTGTTPSLLRASACRGLLVGEAGLSQGDILVFAAGDERATQALGWLRERANGACAAVTAMLRKEERLPGSVRMHTVALALEGLGLEQFRVQKAYTRCGRDMLRMANFILEGRHLSYVCDRCGVDDFRGLRYHCAVCHDYDLCSACRESKDDPAEDSPHSKSHPFHVLRPLLGDVCRRVNSSEN